MLWVVQVALWVHEWGRGWVRGVGLVVRACVDRVGRLVALALGVAQHVLLHVLGGARGRGYTGLHTAHQLLLILG